MHFEHVLFCLRLIKSQNLLKHENHITHQIHRIVPNQNLPSLGKSLGKVRFLVWNNRGGFNDATPHILRIIPLHSFSIRFAFAIGQIPAKDYG